MPRNSIRSTNTQNDDFTIASQKIQHRRVLQALQKATTLRQTDQRGSTRSSRSKSMICIQPSNNDTAPLIQPQHHTDRMNQQGSSYPDFVPRERRGSGKRLPPTSRSTSNTLKQTWEKTCSSINKSMENIFADTFNRSMEFNTNVSSLEQIPSSRLSRIKNKDKEKVPPAVECPDQQEEQAEPTATAGTTTGDSDQPEESAPGGKAKVRRSSSLSEQLTNPNGRSTGGHRRNLRASLVKRLSASNLLPHHKSKRNSVTTTDEGGDCTSKELLDVPSPAGKGLPQANQQQPATKRRSVQKAAPSRQVESSKGTGPNKTQSTTKAKEKSSKERSRKRPSTKTKSSTSRQTTSTKKGSTKTTTPSNKGTKHPSTTTAQDTVTTTQRPTRSTRPRSSSRSRRETTTRSSLVPKKQQQQQSQQQQSKNNGISSSTSRNQSRGRSNSCSRRESRAPTQPRRQRSESRSRRTRTGRSNIPGGGGGGGGGGARSRSHSRDHDRAQPHPQPAASSCRIRSPSKARSQSISRRQRHSSLSTPKGATAAEDVNLGPPGNNVGNKAKTAASSGIATKRGSPSPPATTNDGPTLTDNSSKTTKKVTLASPSEESTDGLAPSGIHDNGLSLVAKNAIEASIAELNETLTASVMSAIIASPNVTIIAPPSSASEALNASSAVSPVPRGALVSPVSCSAVSRKRNRKSTTASPTKLNDSQTLSIQSLFGHKSATGKVAAAKNAMPTCPADLDDTESLTLSAIMASPKETKKKTLTPSEELVSSLALSLGQSIASSCKGTKKATSISPSENDSQSLTLSAIMASSEDVKTAKAPSEKLNESLAKSLNRSMTSHKGSKTTNLTSSVELNGSSQSMNPHKGTRKASPTSSSEELNDSQNPIPSSVVASGEEVKNKAPTPSKKLNDSLVQSFGHSMTSRKGSRKSCPSISTELTDSQSLSLSAITSSTRQTKKAEASLSDSLAQSFGQSVTSRKGTKRAKSVSPTELNDGQQACTGPPTKASKATKKVVPTTPPELNESLALSDIHAKPRPGLELLKDANSSNLTGYLENSCISNREQAEARSGDDTTTTASEYTMDTTLAVKRGMTNQGKAARECDYRQDLLAC